MQPAMTVEFDEAEGKIQVGSITTSGQPGWNRADGRPEIPKGVVALAMLATRSRLDELYGQQRTELSGDRNSLAGSLYRAKSEAGTKGKEKEKRWPSRIFGKTIEDFVGKGSGDGNWYVWLGDRQHRKDPLPFGLVIKLGGKDITSNLSELQRVLSALDADAVPLIAPVRVAIIGSARLAYIRDACEGFLKRLADLQVTLISPEKHFTQPHDKPESGEGRELWKTAVHFVLHEKLHGRQPDYWIAAGSQAATALKNYYGDDFGVKGKCPPVLFLAVTYPVGLHIVDCLRSRCEPREVCGVSYGADGLRSIVSMIHYRIQPGCRVRFVYFEDYPQDVEAASQLEKTRLCSEGKLEIVKSTWEDLPSHLNDREPVYVSWFTFESIFEEGTPRSLEILNTLKSRKVVTTSHLNCKRGMAFAACCADDQEIGVLAADLLHEHLLGRKPHLGRCDVVIPRIKYWLHMDRADECGADPFDDQTLADATLIYRYDGHAYRWDAYAQTLVVVE